MLEVKYFKNGDSYEPRSEQDKRRQQSNIEPAQMGRIDGSSGGEPSSGSNP